MITYESFKQNVLPRIKELVSATGYEVSNFDSFYTNESKEGMIFSNQKHCFVVYLDEVYEVFTRADDVFAAVKELLDIAKHSTLPNEFYFSKDYILHNVTATLINTKANSKLLSSAPNKDFFDMSIVYRVKFMSKFYYINNEILQDIGICEETFHKIALLNTHITNNYSYKTMAKTIKDLTGELPCKNHLCEEEVKGDMLVITNSNGSYGANIMLFKLFLKDVSNMYDSSYYVIPSSVHEIITVSTDRNDFMRAEILRDLLREVNSTVVSPNEILSNEVFYYDKSEGKLVNAFNNIFDKSGYHVH